MDFDLQSIWTAAGAAAAAVVVGYLFGFVQSVAPFLPSSGTFRNAAIAALSVALVVLAAIDSGATPEIGNVLTATLVAIGIYNAAKNAHGAGEATALRTVDSATPITTAVPDPGDSRAPVTDL